MRRNPATVVILTGLITGDLLDAVGGSMNVALLRPEKGADGLEAAAGALRRAAGISSPYVLVAADPLAAVAAEWEAMWRIGGQPPGAPAGPGDFELRAGEALAAWRANRFELPDYYLVVADAAAQAGGQTQAVGPAGGQARDEPLLDFHLGPLRSVRPHRVEAVAAATPAGRAAATATALSSLRPGRWWPAMDDIVAAARDFYPGSLAESQPV